MVIEQLEAQVRVELPDNARAGARVRVAAVHEGQEIEVVYRVDRNGKRVFNYYCAGVRMERRTLLMLLCSEGACPKAQEVQQRWRAFNGHADRPARSRVAPLRVLPLMEEVPVEAAGHRCVARPASFECLTSVPGWRTCARTAAQARLGPVRGWGLDRGRPVHRRRDRCIVAALSHTR
ncbi:MAG: hypothetical protein IPG91_22870 [Ideonella sp.]|nr:hypothetical protein [Ideonella sp.]